MPCFHPGRMDSDNIMYCVQRYASYHALAFVLHLVIHFHVVQQSCSATSLASSLVESRRPWFSLCEGHISWGWCAFDCRVPAGWLRSNLCIGTLDHALCKEFLDLFGISHVVSVLGELSAAQKAADRGRFRGIQYQRWSINHQFSSRSAWCILRAGSEF